MPPDIPKVFSLSTVFKIKADLDIDWLRLFSHTLK